MGINMQNPQRVPIAFIVSLDWPSPEHTYDTPEQVVAIKNKIERIYGIEKVQDVFEADTLDACTFTAESAMVRFEQEAEPCKRT